MTEEKHIEHENEMVDDFDDLVSLGKEMEQISEANDEEKVNQTHDASIRSDKTEE
ncbi:SAS053 family DNA gyrase inhibitor [Staphylococcus chromogenes]|uniref:SAS053 family DNA gyrase inhibitor n=1 Tax=Staphylococcus chromogenes TaxID=46126 RepID=UPI0013007731|nr:SAS053 family protein [Staphylococcus chromogenes]MCD8906033.1 hypothetical protein [Staphylococcus chromogenes]MCE4967085.1 hypothetical protein [Staphylococcus chromogenes]MDT0700467.1 SAS053 family protein [Staphylococcus chromogenes]MDU0452216.1 SAS053 family protein [Staphylococcus chromogenes]MEB7825457.1 SAS053 family protein [Staphylococcus chromogenes]